MRGRLEGLARRMWSPDPPAGLRALRAGLAPLSAVYGALSARRNRSLARRGGASVPGLTVVSVGNLAVGGTGKTPLAAWAVGVLQEAGARPAVLLRGYGDDETALHGRWNPGVPVVADPDRVAAARKARDRGADVAVLDDGFQHRRLYRGLDLVLLSLHDPFPGRLLPAGPYREGPQALARADAVVLTRVAGAEDGLWTGDAEAYRAVVKRHAPEALVAVAALAPAGWTDLAGAPAPAPEGPVLAVAGVGRPRAFAAAVATALGPDVELLAFRDHHAYRGADIRRIVRRAGGRTVVTTEKDAVKLSAFVGALGGARVLRLAVRFDEGEGPLRALLEGVVPEEGGPPR